MGPTPGSTQAVERGSASERRGPRHNTERPRGVRLRERGRMQDECWVSPHVKGLRQWGAGAWGQGRGRGRCLPGTEFQFGTVRKLWGRPWCRDGRAALGMCSTPPSRARRLRHVSPGTARRRGLPARAAAAGTLRARGGVCLTHSRFGAEQGEPPATIRALGSRALFAGEVLLLGECHGRGVPTFGVVACLRHRIIDYILLYFCHSETLS